MRVLTVRQPWAWAIIHGGKTVENKVRNIAGSYRGLVAIHAGLTDDVTARSSVTLSNAMSEWFRNDDDGYHEVEPWLRFHGEIIGIAHLTGVHEAEACLVADLQNLVTMYQTGGINKQLVEARPSDPGGGLIGKARMCSNWADDDGYHLVLTNPRPLNDPIPYKGAPGLRKLPVDVITEIGKRLD